MKDYTIKSNDQKFYENLIKTMPINPICMNIRFAAESGIWTAQFNGLENNNPSYNSYKNVRFIYDNKQDYFNPFIENNFGEIENKKASFLLENFLNIRPYTVEYISGLEGGEKAFLRFRDKLFEQMLISYHINNARFDFSHNKDIGITSLLSIDANYKKEASLHLFEAQTIDDIVTEKNNILREWFTSLREEN